MLIPKYFKSLKFQHSKKPLAICGGIFAGLALMGMIRRISMPYFSALRFMKVYKKVKYLTPYEKEIYVQRPEENEISSLIKKTKEDFFVITGPKSNYLNIFLRGWKILTSSTYGGYILKETRSLY